MKKILLASATVLGLLFGNSAHSASTTGTFNVVVNLTPACRFVTASPFTAMTFAYTSFGAAQNPTTSFDMQCSNLLPFTLSLDGAGFGGTTTTLGLDYVLTLAAGTPSAGTGVNQTITIDGSMAANQAGTCANPAGCSSTTLRTLTLTY